MPGLVGRTRYARTGDLRIAYEVRSPAVSRRPVLLLIQGLGLDRAGWGPALGRLQRRFRLVLVDNRGSGRSAAAGPFSVADMAADAVAVLDHRWVFASLYTQPLEAAAIRDLIRARLMLPGAPQLLLQLGRARTTQATSRRPPAELMEP
jgi:hypothetical protein